MILDHNGHSASFARDKQELKRTLGDKLDAVIEKHLGRKPMEGEIERKGKQMIHPNGNVTYCWEETPLLKVLFGRSKITILEV